MMVTNMTTFNFIKGPVPVLDPARLDMMARVATAQPQYTPVQNRGWGDRMSTIFSLVFMPVPVRAFALATACVAIFAFSFLVGQDVGVTNTGTSTTVARAQNDDGAVYDLADIVIYGDDVFSAAASQTMDTNENDSFGDILLEGVFEDLI